MTSPARLYLDTNILVLFKEVQVQEQALLAELFKVCQSVGSIPVTSALTYSELLVKPLASGHRELIETYEEWMSGGFWLETVPVSRDLLMTASLIRAHARKIKLPDAIHLASALTTHCDIFLSADAGLTDINELTHPLRGKLPITPLKVMRPDVETLTSLTASLSP